MGGVSMERKEVRLGDIADVQTGPFGSQLHKSDYIAEGIPCIMPTNIGPHLNFIVDGIAHVSEVDANRLSRHLTEIGDIIYARRGDIEKCAYVTTNEEKWLCGTGCLKIRCNNEVNSRFIAYLLSTAECKKWITGNAVGTTMLNLSKGILSNLPLLVPSHEDQRRIASILSSLDRKIELNNKINADLEEMAQAIFKNWFVDFEPFKDGKFVDSELGKIPEGWKVGRADDFYQINIGKTPPRKEHKCFSTNPADKIWVSIANMGNSGIFISDSSEYLTKEAVDRHNIIMVPRNTILLSFKLTVGRVAIADKELTTNEAIARFILSDDKYMEYLYLYLKNFDYNSLGSTSSIATAVNSKTIKGMQMLQPSDKIIDAFHIQVNPIFEKIRSLTKESSRLSLLRDTLLPRLMSGELEVPE